MIDPVARQKVQQIVVAHVSSGAMFTAFDVTLAARAQGVQIRHNDGRDIVHEMFQTGVMGAGYRRTVVDIGTGTNPFVYHPFSSDPKTYTSPQSGAAAQATPAPAPASTQSSSQPGLLGRMLNALRGGRGNSSTNSGNAQPPTNRATNGPSNTPRVRRESVKMDLDASQFLPIARNELLAGAKKLSLWGNPWFGRRDLIPPASDARTKLIDRGMISQGLLSAEEAAEIHRVGAEMDYYRPNVMLINLESTKAGQEAVEAERERHAEEKQKKKEEAAARKEARRQAIEQRRVSDIVFLGRGVSSQLSDHQSDAVKLADNQLPVLATPADLATALGLSVSKLRWLAYHNDVATRVHYVRFQIPKRSGGTRTLCSPHQSLATAQRWILDKILSTLSCEDAAHGFVPGRSILTGAFEHVDRDVVINMDLEDFFPSIGFNRVRFLFKSIGYSPSVATILALLCTEAPRRPVTYAGQHYLVATGPRGLPQGACTSPAISNQIARRLDRRLSGLANKLGLTYTRYADDLTCSGNQELNAKVGYVMARIRHIAEDEGFAVNAKKTRVLRRNTAQVVTGLVVNDKATVSRRKIRLLRAILHNARHNGLESQNRIQHPNFRGYLQGHIAFIAMTRPELARKLKADLQSIA